MASIVREERKTRYDSFHHGKSHGEACLFVFAVSIWM